MLAVPLGNTYIHCSHTLMFLFTALAIRCYECIPEFSNTSSLLDVLGNSSSPVHVCGNPKNTIECSGMYDSCVTIKMTGIAPLVGGFTIHSLNCTSRWACVDVMKNMTCAAMQNATDAAGVELTSCDMSCCQGDLCNGPEVPSATTSADNTTQGPTGSTTAKSSVKSINFPLNSALCGILSVIPLTVMSIF